MPSKLYIYAGIAVAIFLAGWQVNGWRLNEKMKSMQLEAEKQYSKNITLARELERKSQAFNDLVAAEVLKDLNEADKAADSVHDEVREYEENSLADDRCNINSEWVRIHDSATGMPPSPQALANVDGTAKSVRDADALSVVTENYAGCTEDRVKLKGLQKWADGISKAAQGG